MHYNPGTAFVFSVAEKYHGAMNGNNQYLTKTDVRQIKNMFIASIDTGHFYDYYAAKTYIVVEILINILQQKLQMANSLYEMIKEIHDELHDKNPEPDIGVMRIEEFTIIETDRPCIVTLQSETATEILFGLFSIGYRFNAEFLANCDTNFRNIHQL